MLDVRLSLLEMPSQQTESKMRELIVTEFISVDGIAEVEKLPSVSWNDEMNRFKEEELADSGAMLLGRTTYEIFAGSWPEETGDFAERFNALPKYVASTTLKELDWKPAELLKDPLPDAIRKLKAGSGGNIHVHGSLCIAQQLLRHGLVDSDQVTELSRNCRRGKTILPVRRTARPRTRLRHTFQQRRAGSRIHSNQR